MKKIIIMVVLLLVLAGAGVGGWFYYQGLQEPEAVNADAPPPPPPHPVFVRISPVVVPVIGNTKAEQFITLVVSLEVDGDSKAAQVQEQMPRLVDAFIVALYGVLDDESVMDGKIVNIPLIKGKLKEAANKALGPGIVHQVLVQTLTRRGL